MKLVAGINYDGNGIAQSINAIQTSMDMMGIFSENILGFDKIGYQRKEAVLSSFAEYIGPAALSYTVDTQVGRLAMTQYPLDVALSEKGYFQVVNKDGSVELTRDGRFQMTKDGDIVTQAGQHVLSSGGMPLRLPVIPDELNKIVIGLDGKIGVMDSEKRGLIPAGTLGVVTSDGSLVTSNCVRQGYVESSNVSLEREYTEITNYTKTVEANSTMFRIQNSKLNKAIQSLGQV